MTEAAVAVLIPAFWADATLPMTLDSLCAQSFAAWEAVVVCDDGRDAAAVLAHAGVRDPRIRSASTGRVGAGPSAARNVGLAATTAPLVAPLDADDRFRADRLARLVPLALAHGAAADNVAVVRAADEAPLGRLFAPGTAPARLDGGAFLSTSVPMFPLFRRSLTAGWDESLRFAEDVAFNLRLLDRLGTLPLDPEPLYQYRVRPGSLAASPGSAAAAEQAYATMLAQVEANGFGLTTPALCQQFRERLTAKRALNQAFAKSGYDNFQDFLAAGRFP